MTVYTKASKNSIVRAEKEDDNLYAAIDDVAAVVLRKVRGGARLACIGDSSRA